MFSASSGPPPWQSRGSYSQLHDQSAYITVPARHGLATSPSIPPPPPTYIPAPYSQQYSTPSKVPPPPSSASVNSPAISTNSDRKKTNWSPEIRDYVNRSFAQESSISGISREEMEAKLKMIITNAAQSGSLDAVDWKTLPLPQEMILQDRNRAVLHALPSSFVPQVSMSTPSSQSSSPPLPDTLRKRKSSELTTENNDATIPPPWRNNSKAGGSLADRVSFASPPEKRPRFDINHSVSKPGTSLAQRKKRFDDPQSGSYSPQTHHSSRGASTEPENNGPIVGRSQKLEKNYFRLTSAPNPDDVRPLEVLRMTLDHLKRKWRSDNNYVYICDQFKSLRQDLTVQHIKNEFTTNVYEIHARIALEKGDLGEYNQCQTQLRALYRQNLGGHPVEFTAYRILYFIHTCNRTDMNDALSDLTPADQKEPAIKHALEVRSALALGNYHKFFKLYLSVPNMGAYLMDMFVERERIAALACICKGYKPDVRLRFVTEELAFEHDEEAAQFILDHAPEGTNDLLQEREGYVRLITSKAGNVFESARMAAFRHVDIKGQI